MPHALLNTLLLEEYCNIFLGKTAFAFKKDNLIQKPRGLILFSHPLHDPAILTHPAGLTKVRTGPATTLARTAAEQACCTPALDGLKKKKKKSPFCLLVITPDCWQVGSQQPGSTEVTSFRKQGALHQEGGVGSPPSVQGPVEQQAVSEHGTASCRGRPCLSPPCNAATF